MAGSINKVDYNVLENAVSVYANQASAIDEVINYLVKMNSELQSGWTNQTSDAFINRFESEYKVNLQNIRDALQNISDYIKKYSANRQEEDAQGASAIGG